MAPADPNESVQTNLIALCAIMLALSILALGLRLWSNHIVPSHTWGWDDFFAVITLVGVCLAHMIQNTRGNFPRLTHTQPLIIVENSLTFWWISLGLGKHAATIPPEDLVTGYKLNCIISFPKFSALFFYRRIFGRISKWFNIAIWAVGALNGAWLLAVLVTTTFQCTPVHAMWTQGLGSSCIPPWIWFFRSAVPSMIIDIFILTMPLPLLWGLPVRLSRRIIVFVVFICGYGYVFILTISPRPTWFYPI